jgi:metal transporter CNNM
VLLSGLFSGLTLGLLSLDTHALKRRAKHGDADAAAVYPIRSKGNLLLATLLFGNVAVNTTLSIFLTNIATGLVAGLVATGLIVTLGEIVPQAVISRHALWFGARTLWFTKISLVLFYPVTKPIAVLLDRALGSELPAFYSHSELMDIISEHEESEHSQIDADEERILHGALQFSHRRVHEVMTAIQDVITYDWETKLTSATLEEINNHGYSRLPVYSGSPENVVGILYVKDLIVEAENVAIKDTTTAFDTDFLIVKEMTKLDTILTRMLKTRQHIAIAQNKSKQYVGIISLEDIIEEIIQHEIEDEDDV